MHKLFSVTTHCHLFIHTTHLPLDEMLSKSHLRPNLHSNIRLNHIWLMICTLYAKINEHVCNSFQSSKEVSSGRFTLDESCNLLELVMNQQTTKNFDSLDIKKINFKAIGDAMHRFLLSWNTCLLKYFKKLNFINIVSVYVQNCTL